MKTFSASATDLVARARAKFEDPKNTFCYRDLDAALDDALFDMKQELAELKEEVERALADPGLQQTPDAPDWEKLVVRVT